jgi:hypothetical protein
MKKLIVLTLALLMCACVQDKHRDNVKRVDEVRQYLIEKLEITNENEIAFINTTNPDISEINEILHYWFKSNKKAIYTVEAQSGKDFHIFSAKRN